MARRRLRPRPVAGGTTFDPQRFGLAKGILCGIILFVLAMSGKGGQFVALIAGIFPGYNATLMGAIIGFIYGLIAAGICGYIFASLYNYLKGKV